MRRWLLAFVAVLAVAGCGAGVGSVGSGDASGASTTTGALSTTTSYGSTASWLAVGNDIEAARKTGALPDPGYEPMLSEPVDIIAPGTYDIWAGPLPPNVVVPPTVAVSFPPGAESDFDVDGSSIHPSAVEHNGSQFLYLALVVKAVTSPYKGLQVWFQ